MGVTRYAENTSVAPDKSRVEFERTLQRYGAAGFMYGWEAGRAVLGFEMNDRRVKFVLPPPDISDQELMTTPTGKMRSSDQSVALHQKAIRQRWRTLALAIKAKLEAVESGITEFEEEILAQLVIPGTGGQTIGDRMLPQIESDYQGHGLPPLLPGPSNV